jgi:cystathionine gamma-synthase
VHKSIQELAGDIVEKYGAAGQGAMLFPSSKIGALFSHFILSHPQSKLSKDQITILELSSEHWLSENSQHARLASPTIYAGLFPQDHFPIAKQFWQHTGSGISSRRAEYCQALFDNGHLTLQKDAIAPDVLKGPRRYRRAPSTNDARYNGTTKTPSSIDDEDKFIEERFGRNLDISLSDNAKLAVRKRIAGRLLLNVGLSQALKSPSEENIAKTGRTISEDDVYLYPCGMNAIFNSHQNLLSNMGSCKSVCYG